MRRLHLTQDGKSTILFGTEMERGYWYSIEEGEPDGRVGNMKGGQPPERQ